LHDCGTFGILPKKTSALDKGFLKMCLAIPSKIVNIENNVATIDVDGVKREASLLLVENPKIGDYVIVHAGFAINKINEEDALESLKLLKEAASLIFDNDKQK
jgi:hydrogenase expression/formation protein HypC